jgi:hypothetical protein
MTDGGRRWPPPRLRRNPMICLILHPQSALGCLARLRRKSGKHRAPLAPTLRDGVRPEPSLRISGLAIRRARQRSRISGAPTPFNLLNPMRQPRYTHRRRRPSTGEASERLSRANIDQPRRPICVGVRFLTRKVAYGAACEVARAGHGCGDGRGARRGVRSTPIARVATGFSSKIASKCKKLVRCSLNRGTKI